MVVLLILLVEIRQVSWLYSQLKDWGAAEADLVAQAIRTAGVGTLIGLTRHWWPHELFVIQAEIISVKFGAMCLYSLDQFSINNPNDPSILVHNNPGFSPFYSYSNSMLLHDHPRQSYVLCFLMFSLVQFLWFIQYNSCQELLAAATDGWHIRQKEPFSVRKDGFFLGVPPTGMGEMVVWLVLHNAMSTFTNSMTVINAGKPQPSSNHLRRETASNL